MLRILYLVHDLHDPAVRRRVMMLAAGGADVTLAGFRRGAAPSGEVAGVRPVDLGGTADGRFAQRIGAVAAAAVKLAARLKDEPAPDIIIGRNLEMLALARRAKSLFGGQAPIVYECLDIHRLLLRGDLAGRALRAVERSLARDADLLVTSSPAFLREYFEPRGQFAGPTLLVENKVLELGDAPSNEALPDREGVSPIRIGWFGALRCRRSLEILSDFARRMGGRYEIVLRGRPAYGEFPDFDRRVAAAPHMRFEGAYRNPEDLASIYGEVDFTWAIDFFEEGLNSSWLLPNRLYEGCRHGAVPIAVRETETARFLERESLGLVLDEPTADALADLLEPIDEGAYAAHRARVAASGAGRWRADRADCRSLVQRLQTLLAGNAGFSSVREIAA